MKFGLGEIELGEAFHIASFNGQSARSTRPFGCVMISKGDGSGITERLGFLEDAEGRKHRFGFSTSGGDWLGPQWSSTIETAVDGRARWNTWRSQPEFDLAEWTVGRGPLKRTRTIFLLRNKGLALLAEQNLGQGHHARMSIALAPGVNSRPDAASRGVQLTRPGSRSIVSMLPVGLPCRPYETERGKIEVREGAISVEQSGNDTARWLPLVLSWHPARDRQPVHWRPLTITEERKVCAPSTAFAVRVGWKGEPYSLVVYRSFDRPSTRCFLGYQTEARFLVALFSPEGDMKPIVALGAES